MEYNKWYWNVISRTNQLDVPMKLCYMEHVHTICKIITFIPIPGVLFVIKGPKCSIIPPIVKVSEQSESVHLTKVILPEHTEKM